MAAVQLSTSLEQAVPDQLPLIRENPEETCAIKQMYRIGRGNFGDVYYATHKDEVVAVKKMSLRLKGKDQAERFRDILNEVKFINMTHNEFCVSFRGGYITNDHVWLLMEYCIGSANDIVNVHKQSLNESEIASVLRDTLCALVYLHSLNRIHRDVKASNILVTEDGVAKLGDFGTASLVCPTGSFVGTPYWMAPEVILSMDDGQYDQQADIWSLGITCIELAEREPPHFQSNAMSALYKIAQSEPPTLKDKKKWCPSIHSFLDSCLQFPPTNRKTSEQLLSDPFIVDNASRQVLVKLINRTKTAVLQLDDIRRKKMKKLLLCEANAHLNSSHPQEHYEALLEQQITTQQNDKGKNGSVGQESLATFKSSSSSSCTSARYIGGMHDDADSDLIESLSVLSIAQTEVLDVEEEEEDKVEIKQEAGSFQHNRLAGVAAGEGIPPLDSHMHHLKFPTIRPVIRREKSLSSSSSSLSSSTTTASMAPDDIGSFAGYTQMRTQQQKKLNAFQERCYESEQELMIKCNRDEEVQRVRFENEYEKSVGKHEKEVQNWRKFLDTRIKRAMSEQETQMSNELKKFTDEQMRLYRMQKESHKRDLAHSEKKRNSLMPSIGHGSTSSLFGSKSALMMMKKKAYKEHLKVHMRQEIESKKNSLSEQLENVKEKLNAKKDRKLHEIQIRQCKEQMTMQDEHLRQMGLLRKKHLEMIHDTQRNNFLSCHRLRNELQQKQEEREIKHQRAYNQKREKQLMKKQANALKYLPSQIKERTSKLKEIYKQDCVSFDRRLVAPVSDIAKLVPLALQQRLSNDECIRTPTSTSEQHEQRDRLKQRFSGSILEVKEQMTCALKAKHRSEIEILKHELETEMSKLLEAQASNRRRVERQFIRDQERLEKQLLSNSQILQVQIDIAHRNLFESHSEALRSLGDSDLAARKLSFDDDWSVSDTMSSSNINSQSMMFSP